MLCFRPAATGEQCLLFVGHIHCSVSDKPRNKNPNSILYPVDWFPMKNAGQQRMVELFLDILSESTGLEVQKLSLESEWAKTGLEDLRGTTLEEYLDKVCLVTRTVLAKDPRD